MSPNTFSLSKFIESLNLSTVDACCCLWGLPSKNSIFLPTFNTEGIVSKARELAKTQNVYMPIALFPKPPEKGRGTARDASHLIGLFADIDTMEKPDPKGHKYAPDKETARSILEEMPFKPAYVTDSGYGLHVLWPFSEPLELHDTAQREEVFLVFKRYQKALEAHFNKHGYEVDKVGDPVRVIRVPDTQNHKGEKPVPVTIIEANPENRVTMEEIRTYLDDHHPELAKPKKAGKAFPLADAELIREECGWFNQCIAGSEDLSEKDWYAFLSIVGNCKDSQKLAHEYSSDYPDYNESKTAQKLNQAVTEAGPRTCENIRMECGGEEFCNQCPHWRNITSPIQLGYKANEASNTKDKLLATASQVEFWRTKNDTAYASITRDGHSEHMPLHSPRFRKWLTHRMREEYGKIPTKQAIDEVLGVLDAQALFDGQEYEVYQRIAYHNESLYIDRGTEDWSVIEIGANGWRIVADSPVRFIRSDSVQPLPEPAKEGDITKLQQFVNCDNEDDFKLMIGLVLGIFAPHKPYPIGVFVGNPGSGKSTRARTIINLTDPSTAPLVGAPREERDVFASAASRWLTTLDNVKRVSDNISDALCCVSTGIAYSGRQYFTNMGNFETPEIARPMMMTGIELRLRQDLRSRAIYFDFPPLDAKDCITEKDYYAAFSEAAPVIFTGILDALSCALKNWQKTAEELQGSELPRLADHTIWVSAAEEVLGWEKGTYRAILLKHQRDGIADSDMNSIFGQVMLGFLSANATQGGTSDTWQVNKLYSEVTQWIDKSSKIRSEERKYVPRSPASFSKKLRGIAPTLAYYGASFEFDVAHEGNKRALRITLSEEFITEAKYRVF